MSALVALLKMAAQGRSPAVAKITQRSSLFGGKHRVPAIQKVALMSAEDIGQFQPMPGHHLIGGMRMSSDSSGLVVARTLMSETWR